jgi:prophage regulatory protein
MQERLYRISELIPKDKNKPRLIPVSRSTWWKGVKEGRFPQPVKLGPRTTCWRESDIAELLKHGVVIEEDEKKPDHG